MSDGWRWKNSAATRPLGPRALRTRTREKLIGVYVGILAVVLAICSLGDSNAQQRRDPAKYRGLERLVVLPGQERPPPDAPAARGEFDVMLKATPAMPDDAKKMIEQKIADYKELDKQLTTDPKSGEGLDELFAKGKALEASRDEALKRGPYFDYGQALLQIAIVLASVALISGGNILLYFSFALGGLGAVLTIGGFTLVFPLPGFLS